MNLQQLKCFITVANTLNFTQAGQRLFLSQTAVTNHIHHLEAEIGFQLFERTRQKVKLTEKGEKFLPCALKMIAVEKDCYDMISYLHHHQIGKLKIGYLRGLENCMMADVLQRFYQSHEHIEIELFRQNHEELENLLVNGDVDAVFTVYGHLISKAQHDDLVFCHVASYPFVAAFHKNHLLSHQKHLTYYDVINQSHVILDSSDPHYVSSDIDVVLMNLIFHDNSAVLAKFTQYCGRYERYLMFKEIEDFERQFKIYFVYRKNHKIEILKDLLECIEQGG